MKGQTIPTVVGGLCYGKLPATEDQKQMVLAVGQGNANPFLKMIDGSVGAINDLVDLAMMAQGQMGNVVSKDLHVPPTVLYGLFVVA